MQRPNHNTDTQPGVYPDPKVLGDVRESETAENRGPRLTAEMSFGEGAARPIPLATEHGGAGPRPPKSSTLLSAPGMSSCNTTTL